MNLIFIWIFEQQCNSKANQYAFLFLNSICNGCSATIESVWWSYSGFTKQPNPKQQLLFRTRLIRLTVWRQPSVHSAHLVRKSRSGAPRMRKLRSPLQGVQSHQRHPISIVGQSNASRASPCWEDMPVSPLPFRFVQPSFPNLFERKVRSAHPEVN